MKKFILTTALFFCVCLVAAAQQNKVVIGTVVDSDGPIPYVTVKIQGTKKATITDIRGCYSIRCKSSDVLIFGCVGYKLETEFVNNRTVINVTMKPDVNATIVTPSSYDYAYIDSQKLSAVIFRKREIV